jgi:hypothetical protein
MIRILNTMTGHTHELDGDEIRYEDYPVLSKYVQGVALAYFHDYPQNWVRGSMDWFGAVKVGGNIEVPAKAEIICGKRQKSKKFTVQLSLF